MGGSVSECALKERGGRVAGGTVVSAHWRARTLDRPSGERARVRNERPVKFRSSVKNAREKRTDRARASSERKMERDALSP